jgi:hypothetical protein
VTFERVNVQDGWRNAAAISAGGFFFEELTAAGDELLRFSVTRSGETPAVSWSLSWLAT